MLTFLSHRTVNSVIAKSDLYYCLVVMIKYRIIIYAVLVIIIMYAIEYFILFM